MARRNTDEHLGSLRDLKDIEVADHEPDPRGWQVVSADGRNVGRVDDLIVDTTEMRVRYLDCDLDETALNLKGSDRERHILIPIESVSMSRADRQVAIQGVNANDVVDLPAFTRGALTGALASTVKAAFGGRSEEEMSVGKHTVDAGERVRDDADRLRDRGKSEFDKLRERGKDELDKLRGRRDS